MALTGSLFGTVCYADLPSATNAFFASQSPFTYQNGASVYQVTYQNISGVWDVVTTNISAVPNLVVSTVQALQPSLASCDPLVGWTDGLTFGSLLLAAVVSATVFGIISRAL